MKVGAVVEPVDDFDATNNPGLSPVDSIRGVKNAILPAVLITPRPTKLAEAVNASLGNCLRGDSQFLRDSLMLPRLRHLLEMIRFSHTLFALPFALLSAVLAWR